MANRKPLVAGNWKMNLTHLEAIALVQKIAFTLKPDELDAVETVVLPAFTSLRSVQTLIDGDSIRLGYGAQDLSSRSDGAYTGEISAAMLTALRCGFVTVGHSERREYHGETDDVVRAKVAAAIGGGLTPILCLGEGLEIRQHAFERVAHQLIAKNVGEILERLRSSAALAQFADTDLRVQLYEM